MVMCDNVKVPWERVFVMDDAVLAREIYIRTPAHCYGNHQSNVRFWSKLRLIVGAGQPGRAIDRRRTRSRRCANCSAGWPRSKRRSAA